MIRFMAVPERACAAAIPDQRAWLSGFERSVPPTDDWTLVGPSENPR